MISQIVKKISCPGKKKECHEDHQEDAVAVAVAAAAAAAGPNPALAARATSTKAHEPGNAETTP
jgi:hypothetical protein